MTKAIRTLIDLLDTEHGYARIFFDLDSFSYELCTYELQPIADLFERMMGYPSAEEACKAARHQLAAMHPARRPNSRKASKPKTRKTQASSGAAAGRRRSQQQQGSSRLF